jgi:DNA-binding beta-propeller fold protein YncE
MKTWLRIFFIGLLISIPVHSGAQHIVQEFNAPGTESRGLAWDGQYLWCADAAKDSIYKIDPTTGQVIHSIYFDLDFTYGGGIVWSDDAALWVTRWQYFRKLDPSTGQEITNFHCPGG